MKLNKKNVKDVLNLALPAVGEMTLYMMVWVFDTMMVGKFGGNVAVSSVGLSSEIIYTFSNILVACGISIGITSLVARNVGAKRNEDAEKYGTYGFFVTILISTVLVFIFFTFSEEIFKLCGAEENVIELGAMYMRIICFGLFFNMLMNSLNALLRGSGNTKIPLIAAIIINIINLSLDYILIFGKLGMPQFGVKGAAIATAIAQISGFIFILVYILKYSKLKVRLRYIKNIEKHRVKGLFKLAIPSAMQEGAFSISRLIGGVFIVGLGTVAFAANQITTTVESISFMPGWGFAVAATTLVGQKIGERDFKKAREYAHTAIILGFLVMTFFGALFVIIPNVFINFFITPTEKEVISLATYCLMIAGIEQPFMAVSMIVGGVLKGSGDTKTPFKVSFGTSWFLRLPLMFLAIYILKLSVTYVWIITTFQWTLDGAIIYYLYKKKFKDSIIDENLA